MVSTDVMLVKLMTIVNNTTAKITESFNYNNWQNRKKIIKYLYKKDKRHIWKNEQICLKKYPNENNIIITIVTDKKYLDLTKRI